MFIALVQELSNFQSVSFLVLSKLQVKFYIQSLKACQGLRKTLLTHPDPLNPKHG